ncbi:hypothetical protein ABPG72_019470 [Tetrahymena utriculariae]
MDTSSKFDQSRLLPSPRSKTDKLAQSVSDHKLKSFIKKKFQTILSKVKETQDQFYQKKTKSSKHSYVTDFIKDDFVQEKILMNVDEENSQKVSDNAVLNQRRDINFIRDAMNIKFNIKKKNISYLVLIMSYISMIIVALTQKLQIDNNLKQNQINLQYLTIPYKSQQEISNILRMVNLNTLLEAEFLQKLEQTEYQNLKIDFLKYQKQNLQNFRKIISDAENQLQDQELVELFGQMNIQMIYLNRLDNSCQNYFFYQNYIQIASSIQSLEKDFIASQVDIILNIKEKLNWLLISQIVINTIMIVLQIPIFYFYLKEQEKLLSLFGTFSTQTTNQLIQKSYTRFYTLTRRISTEINQKINKDFLENSETQVGLIRTQIVDSLGNFVFGLSDKMYPLEEDYFGINQLIKSRLKIILNDVYSVDESLQQLQKNITNTNFASSNNYQQFLLDLLQGNICQALMGKPEYLKIMSTLQIEDCTKVQNQILTQGFLVSYKRLVDQIQQFYQLIETQDNQSFLKLKRQFLNHFELYQFQRFTEFLIISLESVEQFIISVNSQAFEFLENVLIWLCYFQIGAVTIFILFEQVYYFSQNNQKMNQMKQFLKVLDLESLANNPFVLKYFKQNVKQN